MLTLVRERALQRHVFSMHSSFAYSYFYFYLKTMNNFMGSKIRLVLLTGVICQHFIFLQTATCFTCFCWC